MRVGLVLLASLLLLEILAAGGALAGLYGNATLEELEKSLRSLLEKGGALPAKTVAESLERLSACASGNYSRAFAEAAVGLLRGAWNGTIVRTAILSCPSCFRGCRASDVYIALLASFSRVVGSSLSYSNTSRVEALLPLLQLPPYLWVDVKTAFGYDPRYWSMLAALATGARLDERFWSVLEETGGERLLCTGIVVADAGPLAEQARSLLGRLVGRGVHPLNALSRMLPEDRLVCAYAASRLYILAAPPEAQQLYTLYAIGERLVGHLSLTALELLLRGTREHIVTLGGRAGPAFLADVVSSLASLPDGFRYELCCFVTSLHRRLEAVGARAACSRSVEPYGLVEANWLTWGRLVYTTPVSNETVKKLEECAGVTRQDALEYCVRGVKVSNVTRAGCIARLAAIVGDRLDWVRVRACAHQLLGRAAPLTGPVPLDPMVAWASGYIDTILPPPPGSVKELLGKIVEAWRLAQQLGLEKLASRLRVLARLVAAGNATGAEREAAALRSLLESIASVLSSNPRLASLVSQIAALRVEKGVFTIDVREAAKILASMLGVDVNASRAAIEGRATDILEMLARGLIGVGEAKKLLEAASIPEELREELLGVVSRIEAGDWRLYYRLVRVLAPVAEAPGAVAAPGPAPVLALADPRPLVAALVVGALLAALYNYRGVFSGLVSRLRRGGGGLEPYQREMARLLEALGRRYGVVREDWETLREYLERLPATARDRLRRVVEAYEEARYGARNRDRVLGVVRRARRELGA